MGALLSADSSRAAAVGGGGVVTLTETSVIVTWYAGVPALTGDRLKPSPQNTELRMGTSPRRMRTVVHDTSRTPFGGVVVAAAAIAAGRSAHRAARDDEG
jgi:hypothetical protein